MISAVRWVCRPYLRQEGDGTWRTHPKDVGKVNIYNGGAWNMLTIPAGFICDGASIPLIGFLRTFLPKSRANNAGVVHDYLYRRCGYYTRSEADMIFRLLLEKEQFDSWWSGFKWHKIGVPLGYWAVRVFGGLFYKGGVK